ncbi:MAG: hypothetical protein ACF8PN_15805 [Phycisphaerales bacterium]
MRHLTLLLVVIAAFAPRLLADVVDDPSQLPGRRKTIDFREFIGAIEFTNGPIEIGAGVHWSASAAGAVGDLAVGLRDNGVWDRERKAFAAVNAPDAWMEIHFDEPVSGVIAFVNYAPLAGSALPAVEAISADGRVLERFSTTISTPGGVNEGQYLGFNRATADIVLLRYSARYGVLDNLSYTRGPEPTPAAALMLIGMVVVVRRAPSAWSLHRVGDREDRKQE